MFIPRSLLIPATGFLAGRARRRLGRTGADGAGQARAFSRLCRALAGTEVWGRAGVEAGMPYGAFRGRIAPAGYEDLAPAIERMKRGEAGILWPGRCSRFAVSSGTTAGRTKFLPVTEAMLGHFRRTGLDSLLAFAARTGRSSVFGGRHLFLGGSTALSPLPAPCAPGAVSGDLSGITALHLPGWVEAHLYEPGRDIARMADWPAKIEAIAERTLGRDIRLLAGIPSWILIFAEVLRARAARGGRAAPDLRTLWPNLECFVHGGVPIGPFVDELRGALGPGVAFHEVYPASEAFIALQDAEAGAGLRLLTGAGVFYEFLPLEDYVEGRPASGLDRIVPLEGVRTGVDYVLLLTTPAGLVRYVLGDVVRFTSTEPARLIYAGRTRLQLSAFGEHVIEREITEAVSLVGRRRGLRIAHFHVAPLFVDVSAGRARGGHEWLIELSGEFPPHPQSASDLARELDQELKRLNDDYEAKRLGGGLEEPQVRFVRPGLFEGWMRRQGKWGGQNKMPRCRSDRQVADALAALGS